MNAEIEKLRAEAENARLLYRLGGISRKEAAKRILPYAEAFNAKSKELAKKYGQRAGSFSLAAFLR